MKSFIPRQCSQASLADAGLSNTESASIGRGWSLCSPLSRVGAAFARRRSRSVPLGVYQYSLSISETLFISSLSEGVRKPEPLPSDAILHRLKEELSRGSFA